MVITWDSAGESATALTIGSEPVGETKAGP